MCAGIAGLVDVGLGLEVLDADIGDILTRSALRSVAGPHSIGRPRKQSYLDVQIRVHQDLELKVLFAFICDLQRGFECALGQRDAVNQAKLIWPGLAEFLAQHGVRQSEIQLHSEIALARLRRGFAEELPG